MTQLLVSVRNAAEARAAMAGGADIIDVKEPHRGSLGACDVVDIEAVVCDIAGALPVSAACGELAALDHGLLRSLPDRLSFAKIGLAGCGSSLDWPSQWRKALSYIPSTIGRVGVAYADWQQCDAPAPDFVVQHAIGLGCRYVLIDTHSKALPLLDLVSVGTLLSWIGPAQSEGIGIVIAGSLRADLFAEVVDNWVPNVLAVRGAACHGSRESSICQKKTSQLKVTLVAIDQIHTRV